ncbi:Outer membrane receptor proteins, mostly Fe transport [Porphyromonadaceae bacterium KH3CP3RA]|nr:Outer membrane receptor proteins, mostly Fe transport [Porphyromonadaceae bacterium KH3CP3RA]
MRNYHLYTFLFSLLSLSAFNFKLYSQSENYINIKGIVLSEQDSPIPYVNVVVYTMPDSVFFTGGITSDDGAYTLNSPTENCFLTFSFIGFKTEICTFKELQSSDFKIFLKEDAQILEEVQITGYRKLFQSTNTGIKVNITDTPLANIGTINQLLSQLPLIVEERGNISVMGHGRPQFYINNRKIRDISELNSLQSSDVESVEIITNPGTRYGSEVTSVILIKTRKEQGQGLSGSTLASVTKDEKWSTNENINLMYSFSNGVQLFNNLNFSSVAFKQKREYHEVFGQNVVTYTDTYGTAENRTNRFTWQSGFNFDFGLSNSIGMRYELKRTPKSNFLSKSMIKTRIGAEDPEKFSGTSTIKSNDTQHTLNAYLKQKIGRSNLSFDADYIQGNDTQINNTSETGLSSDNHQQIQTNFNSTYDLFASKFEILTPVTNGELLFGGEFSYTGRQQVFDNKLNRETGFLKNSKDNAEQNLYALFTEYDNKMEHVNFYTGVRYEWNDFTYKQNDSVITEQSKNYRNLLPYIGIRFNIKNVVLNLRYKTYISRPGYSLLTSNYTYVSHTLWESGNPYLKPSTRYNWGFDLSWKGFQLMGDFTHRKQNISTIYEEFNDGKSIVRKEINLPDYNTYTFVAVYSRNIKIWQPSIQAFVMFQDLKYGIPIQSYKKPICQLMLRNRFSLPSDYYLYVNAFYLSKGNDRTLYSSGMFHMNSTMQKKFKSGLSVSLSASDFLNTLKQKNSVNTNMISYSYITTGASHGVSLTLSYDFNTTKSKYKGKGAGESEKDRL